MTLHSTKQSRLYLGIDGGGTKCKARLEDEQGNLLGEGLGGPANIVRSVDVSIESIMTATKQAFAAANLTDTDYSRTCAGLGLAGGHVADAKQTFSLWQHPFAQMSFTTDLHIACLGAHQGQNGAVIISGTGFNAGACFNDKYYEIGGHGLMLGDTASGSGLGLQAVRHTFEVLDGVTEPNPLSDMVLSKLGCDSSEQLLNQALSAKPNYFAQLTPHIFELAKHNKQALQLVQYAANKIDLYTQRLLQDKPERLAMIGGLAKPIFNYLAAETQKAIKPVLCTPEQGAIFYAKRF